MTAIAKKRCPRCLAEKSVTAFHRNDTRVDGLQNWCKRCSQLQQRLTRTARTVAAAVQRKQEILARAEAGKACSSCDLVKPLTDYSKDRRKPDGRHGTCKVCAAPGRRDAWARYREKQLATCPTDDGSACARPVIGAPARPAPHDLNQVLFSVACGLMTYRPDAQLG